MIRSIFVVLLFMVITTKGEQCRDTDRRCPEWNLRGDCMRDEELRRRCPQTCGLCRTDDENEILKNIHVSAQHTLLFLYSLIAFIAFAIVIGIIKIKYRGGVCLSKGTMKGKLVVITGGTSGIGLDTAFHLALRGAKVIIGCRSLKRGFKIAKKLRAQTGQQMIEIRKLDLTSFDSIRDFANLITEQFSKVDVLINNAGIYSGKERIVTMDGYESTFQTNYLGHFYLTKLLINKLKDSSPSRIINVVSDEFKKGELDFKNLQGNRDFNNKSAYCNANLAIMHFTKELSKFLKDSGVTANAANPGNSCTDLWRDIFPYGWNLTWFLLSPYTYLFWKTPSMGAETTYYCALDRELEKVSGSYFKDCQKESFPDLNDEVGRKLWAVSERLLAPKKISTLNQAAIKKALNEIVKAEMSKERNEISSTANENDEGDKSDGANASNEDDTKSKVSKKKDDDVSKKKKDDDVIKKKKDDDVRKKKTDVADEGLTSKTPVEQDEKDSDEKSKPLKTNSTNVRNRKSKKKTPGKK